MLCFKIYVFLKNYSEKGSIGFSKSREGVDGTKRLKTSH